ncbi:transcriptional regulator [Corynebacterium deserti GIMN1.010]|uniref:Transcriptional regulator n=1 Tax=Corynebacterium deserti GIMN1.010 TaxID=931089 RepID=A0A0M4CDX0_9CORY|nr:YafY family protein [Corynebacterium deserti]ALC05854.1 transcriptional regulator [Corynebacterium deserti GIMN1.010]
MAKSSDKVSDLARQLSLLPYFSKYPERSILEAAKDLGQPPTQLMEDLNRLWMCGLPGLLPGDLVELEHSYSEVKILNAQGMDKPLRLTPTEAGVLLLTLESLETLPGIAQQDAVISATAKLRAIMGEYSAAVFDSTGEDKDSDVLAVVGDAMDQKRQVRFVYDSHNSDSTATRQVSPAHIFTKEGQTYIRAWEEAVDDSRTFRLDRIHDIVLSDASITTPPRRQLFSAEDPFNFGKSTDNATLLLRSDATWLTNYMSIELDEDIEPIKGTDGNLWYTAYYPLLYKEWFVRFAISHAEHLKVTSPQDLRNCINQKVSSGLSAYDLDVR